MAILEVRELRGLLGDPLVVRHGRGLVPTPRAEELKPLLREATECLALAIDRRGLSPRKRPARSLCRCQTIIRRVMCRAAFSAGMPQATLRVVSADYLAASDGLASGDSCGEAEIWSIRSIKMAAWWSMSSASIKAIPKGWSRTLPKNSSN